MSEEQPMLAGAATEFVVNIAESVAHDRDALGLRPEEHVEQGLPSASGKHHIHVGFGRFLGNS